MKELARRSMKALAIAVALSPFLALAGDLPPSPKTPKPYVSPTPSFDSSTMVSARAQAPFQPKPAVESSLESTLDMAGSASKKATQAALVEQTRLSEGGSGKGPAPLPPTAVPAPGLFIADEPLEPRPKLPSIVTAPVLLMVRAPALLRR